MKYVVRKRKSIPFSWRIEVEIKQNRGFWEWHGEFERGSSEEDNE